MAESDPLISVVIPTRNRPDLVGVAVRSALSQSLHSIEVIVIVDGADARTGEVLGRISDPRLRAKMLAQQSGAAAARNAGVAAARGRWIAFLDDDDEWLPNKLAIQYHAAEKSSHRHPIIACRVIARSQSQDFVWPRRLPLTNEPISEYLFCRKSPFFGEGLVPTNTILTTKELLGTFPFNDRLRDHEDLDWLLRVSAEHGVGVEFVPCAEPLAIWRIDDRWTRMSTRTDWCYSLTWIRERRDLVTSRAYAAYLLTWLGAVAARTKDWRAFLPLVREAYRHGSPASIEVASYLGYWLVPGRLQNRIAAAFAEKLRRSKRANGLR